MLALQAQLERALLDEEPLPMSLKRGRKPGSKVKVLKDGSRVVVTGRAAGALKRKVKLKKPKTKAVKSPAEVGKPKRGPGRPRKEPTAASPAPLRRTTRRKRAPKPRSGVIA